MFSLDFKLKYNYEMKKRAIIILSILVIVTAAGVYLFVNKKTAVSFTLNSEKAHYGYIAKTVTATGSIQPLDTVSVGAQVSGVIKNVMVDFNSIVKKGQLLAQVDRSIIEAQAEQSKANLVNAKSNLEFQKSNFTRQKKLYEYGAISKADFQIALNQFNIAKSDVVNASAQLRLIQKNLSYTNIYSPINGIVLNKNVSAGQTIASNFNSPTLFVIAKDLTKMQVKAAVNEADIGGVRSGQNVTFTVDAFPNDIFKGIVKQILLHPSVSSNVVTYATLISVDNMALKLKPGMTASINIYIEEDSSALLIPSRALSFKPDTVLLKSFHIKSYERKEIKNQKKNSVNLHAKLDSTKINSENEDYQKAYIWVLNGDTLTEKRIVIGLNDDTNVKVIKGISPEDNIITSIAITSKNEKINASSVKSPFMPQMPRRSSGNAKPSK